MVSQLFRRNNYVLTKLECQIFREATVACFLCLQVCDVDRSSAHGFTGSLVSVEGLGQFTGHMIRVTAKNENLLAQQLLPDGSMGKLLACTPDLIALIDSDTGE